MAEKKDVRAEGLGQVAADQVKRERAAGAELRMVELLIELLAEEKGKD